MTATHENAPPAHLGSGADEENTSQVFDSKLAAPQAAIVIDSKYTYETIARLYPQPYPGVTADGFELNRTTSNCFDVRMSAL